MEVSTDYHRNELLMEEAQKALRAASLKKGQKPTTRLSSAELISLRDKIVSGSSSAWVSYITHKYHPSVAPISTLTKIYTQDLRLETNHRGSYVILRTITSPRKVVATISVVEDENGGCELIQLPVFTVSKDRAPKDFLPKGQIFIVKEPFYKSNTSGEFKIGSSICVDHISDIVFLNSDDIRVPLKWQACRQDIDPNKIVTNWKNEGNEFYKCGKFNEAIECYTKGLKATAGEKDIEITKILRLNRSQAFLKLSESIPFHEKAFEDADYVLKLDPNNEKALYRGAKALYISRRFEDCRHLLTRLLKHYKNKDAKNELLKVFRRLQEERSGSYDFQELRQLTSNVERSHGPVKLDCADFVGPISLQDTTDSGKGLFTTRDVKFGELLLFTKAFFIDYPQTDTASLVIDLTTGLMLKSNGEDCLVQNIVQMLYNNPSMIRKFSELYGGSYGGQRVQEEYVDGKPIIDTFLVLEIRVHNAHTASVLSTATDSIALATGSPEELQKAKATDGTGIGIMTSFFNHACWSQGSARRTTIGDMVIIRAAMDIKKGQQLTLEYHNVGDSFRRQALTKSWGFSCKCDLCKVESKETLAVQRTRSAILRSIMSFKSTLLNSTGQLDDLTVTFKKILQLVGALKSTYNNPPSKQPRLMLVTALEFQLSLCSFMQREGVDLTDKMISIIKHILESLGYEIEDSQSLGKVFIVRHGQFPDHVFLHQHAIRCSMMYSVRGNGLMAKAWQELAVDFYEVDFGERVSFFERYKEAFAGVGYWLKEG